MITIHKHQLLPFGTVSIETYANAKVLHIEEQVGVPCIWMLVDTNQPKVRMKLHVVATGEKLPYDNLEWAHSLYWGTFQLAKGAYVGHVFMSMNIELVDNPQQQA